MALMVRRITKERFLGLLRCVPVEEACTSIKTRQDGAGHLPCRDTDDIGMAGRRDSHLFAGVV